MKFGELLATLRKERGVLQKEVATYLNVTVATISNYEKGVHLPDLDTLILLADFLMSLRIICYSEQTTNQV